MFAFCRRQAKRFPQPDAWRNRLIDQFVKGANADRLEHLVAGVAVWTDMAGLEFTWDHFVSSVYWFASSRSLYPDPSSGCTAIIHEPCGSLLTRSGFSASAVLTAVMTPETGA